MRGRWLAAFWMGLFLANGHRSLPASERPVPAAWERLRTLEGSWSGPAVWEQGGETNSVEFEVSYRVVAGGTAILETMMPGTPGEMVTLYSLEGEDLMLVHYCTSGNQPRMKLVSAADPSDLAFRCLGGTNMTEADSHMHSVRIRVVDSDHIRGEWSSVQGDTVNWIAGAELRRRK